MKELASAKSLVVAAAAKRVREERLEGHEDALAAAFERFLVDGAKKDPSCHAKLACLEALDFADHADAGPFLTAARTLQLEKAWGPPVDTAAPVRARGIFGLARIGHADFLLIAARLLGDKEPPVRQAAAEALGHRGDAAGAALALFKLRLGDEDPLVVLAAMGALLALAPGEGLDELRARLDGPERELAAVALGQSRDARALELLLESLEGCARTAERVPLLRGIGMHRSDRALDALLSVIAERNEADARAAVEALAVRRFEPQVATKVRAAAKKSRHDLAALVEKSFS
jgi:HEAT repeat protein